MKAILRQRIFYAFLVFAALLTAYGLTLMPGTVGGDAGELQYAGPLLALVHPTGQPLYVLLGYVWSHLLPLGSMAWRMNLLAAVSAAAGGAALTWLLARVYGNPLVAAAAGLTLGFGAALWGQAVIADKYGFNVLLAALLVGLTLWWGHERQRTPAPKATPQQNRLLYAMSLTFGLCLLHHRSLGLFAIMIAVLLLYYERLELLRNWRRTLLCAALVLLPPLLLYPLFLPLVRARALSPLLWQPNDAAGWVDWLLERHVLTNEALVFDNWANISAQLQIYLATVIHDYTLAALPLALIGFVALLRREPLNGLFLLVSYGLQAFLSANWRGNERQFTYYLPSFVTLLYAYGYGLYALWNAVSRGQMPVRLKRTALLAITALALAVPALQLFYGYPARRADALYGGRLDLWRETLKTGTMGARLARGLSALPPNSVLAADWEQITILWYYQQVEGLRPDVTILYPIERYADFSDRPVCLARHVPLGAEWHPGNVGALICLNAAPIMIAPQNMTPLGTVLYTAEGNAPLELSGYQTQTTAAAGTHLPLLLTWRARETMDADYALSLRILDQSWTQVLPAQDINAPVMGLYPTSRWTAGEYVQDYHEIDLPPELPPGGYLWTVVVYRALADGTFTQLQDAQGNINILGGTLDVSAYGG
ncbi:MAG: DUF2723 domain-containing protein [Chloroflexi bacterium]|nr:DUF2723 domain-containing protein [Chloroflexota bacterium]